MEKTDARQGFFDVDDYKRLPNTAEDIFITKPEEVSKK